MWRYESMFAYCVRCEAGGHAKQYEFRLVLVVIGGETVDGSKKKLAWKMGEIARRTIKNIKMTIEKREQNKR